MFISSPLEQFEVFELIGIHTFLGYTFALTNLGLYVVLTIITIYGINYLVLVDKNIIPTRWQIGLETIFTSINTIVKDQIGSSKEIYFPFIYSFFFFILIGNLFSNVPYNFSIASSAIFALGLSVTLWIGNTIMAFYKHGLTFFSFFLPAGTPTILIPLLFVIELISYSSRALSLGVRLLANLVSGHALLVILSGIIYQIMNSGWVILLASVIPLSIFLTLVGLEIAVSFIQAFVWCTLLCSYIHDSEYLH